ncbi:Outer membrane insertion signal domain protein [Pseudomonas sp. IT-P218]
MTRTRTWDPMINSHLLYRLSYHGTTHFNLQLCSFTAFSSTRSHRCVRVSEARYSTIFSTSVNPLICIQVNDLQLILDSCLKQKPWRVTYCGAHFTSLFLRVQQPE